MPEDNGYDIIIIIVVVISIIIIIIIISSSSSSSSIIIIIIIISIIIIIIIIIIIMNIIMRFSAFGGPKLQGLGPFCSRLCAPRDPRSLPKASVVADDPPDDADALTPSALAGRGA